MVRLLSFIYPVTNKIQSNFNGYLEITWFRCKKYLDTKNANYSYGSLQKILKIGLQKIDIEHCNKILLLGMGGGSVIKTLKEDFKCDGDITAIEIDPVIINLVKDEFLVEQDSNLKIICTDAFNYVKKTNDIYDLIIIDVFVDSDIPEPIYSSKFWLNIIKTTGSGGAILFNASLMNKDQEKVQKVINMLENENFKLEILTKVNKTNTLIIAHSINGMN
jgi:predicted methyltransferase